MSRIEVIGGLVGVVVPFLGLVDSFHAFLMAGLALKLVVLGIAGVTSIVLLTQRLEKRTNFLLGAAALLLACGFFVIVALMLATRSPITLREQTTNSTSSATLLAAYSSTNAVTIQLPSHAASTCVWADAMPQAFPKLDVQMVDWDSAVPKLHVDNFIHPQQIEIKCVPPTSLHSITVDPPLAEMFLQKQLNLWLRWIIIVGGLIWLAACCRLWALSRLA